MKALTLLTTILLCGLNIARAQEVEDIVSSAKTYTCQENDNSTKKLKFTVSASGIQFTEWSSAFGACQMDTTKIFALKIAPRMDIQPSYRAFLQGPTYVVHYNWYYSTFYYFTFETSPLRLNPANDVKLEVNGDDNDGCFLYNQAFTCQVN